MERLQEGEKALACMREWIDSLSPGEKVYKVLTPLGLECSFYNDPSWLEWQKGDRKASFAILNTKLRPVFQKMYGDWMRERIESGIKVVRMVILDAPKGDDMRRWYLEYYLRRMLVPITGETVYWLPRGKVRPELVGLRQDTTQIGGVGIMRAAYDESGVSERLFYRQDAKEDRAGVEAGLLLVKTALQDAEQHGVRLLPA